MTNIELETLKAVKSACKDHEWKERIASAATEYVGGMWERRRYEIAKDCLAAMFSQPSIGLSAENYVDAAVRTADKLIMMLAEK